MLIGGFFRNGNSLEFIDCDLEEINTISPGNLEFSLRRFITEVRELDGSDFPAKTLYQIVVCVQFHLETLGFTWKLLDNKDFTELRFTLNNVMKQRVSDGIDIVVRQAETISEFDEDLLWFKGVLGTENPTQLLETVVYIVGLTCAVRAGKEHRVLRSIPFESQFKWHRDHTHGVYFLRYTEDIGLKTNKGGLKHIKGVSNT